MAQRRALRPDLACRARLGGILGPARARMRLRGGVRKCIIDIFIQVGGKQARPAGRRAAGSRLSAPAGRCGAGSGEPLTGELDILGRYAFFGLADGRGEAPEAGQTTGFGRRSGLIGAQPAHRGGTERTRGALENAYRPKMSRTEPMRLRMARPRAVGPRPVQKEG